MATLAEAVTVKRARLESVDLLRGVVMIIMALDHTRDFFGSPARLPILPYLTVALFHALNTHFAHLSSSCLPAPAPFSRYASEPNLNCRDSSLRAVSGSSFSNSRCSAACHAVQLRLPHHHHQCSLGIRLGDDSALGDLYLPAWVVTTFGVVMIATHNLLDSIDSANPLWSILHSPNVIFSNSDHTVFVAYPLIPWVGVTAAGYGLGQIYGWAPARRRTFLLTFGIGLSIGFVVLRAINIYGDPSRWTTQHTAVFTVLSFLNTTKYPPSLLFLLMTLGPALSSFGRSMATLRTCCVPRSSSARYRCFIFCCTSLLSIFSPSLFVMRATDKCIGCSSPQTSVIFPLLRLPDGDCTLPFVYLIWAFVVMALYPLCRWYAALRQRRNDPWLSYL